MSRILAALAAASAISACADTGVDGAHTEVGAPSATSGTDQPAALPPAAAAPSPSSDPVTPPEPTPDVEMPPSSLPLTPTASPSAPAGNSTAPAANPAAPVTPAPVTPAPAVPREPGLLGSAMMGGSGQTEERYFTTDVTRDGDNYLLMANGWGPNFGSQNISWNGTSFTVENMTGSPGRNYEPASYPTVFCGVYSGTQSGKCSLPAEIASLESLRTGWKWRANGNQGQYNAAYDIWLGTGTTRNTFSGYMMVWLREPPGQQPAGRRTEHRGITVANVPGTWDIWSGTVFNRPIINWVRAEGQDSESLEFDILDFIRDGQARGLPVPGTHVLSVAVGFEIWQGPVQNLESLDFYVEGTPTSQPGAQ